MHLLQVCNVGQIVGGTAACAWSITRAFPDAKHSVAFLSRVDEVTRHAFQPHPTHQWSHCTTKAIQQINPDLVILHNVSSENASLWNGAFTIQYVHSTGRRLAADQTIYCSRWLAEQCRADPQSVVWQGVPLPLPPAATRGKVSERLRIGRICTPSARKWTDSLPAFYSLLATQHPHVDWDFVGCPPAMQPALLSACLGRATFLPAGWLARSHVWEWDALLYHHPTLTESFGRTVAEAARTGCIPIVDARGGFIEQLDVIGGRSCRTTLDFSNAITDIAKPELRLRLSKSAQQRANRHFSLSAFRERLQSLVRNFGLERNQLPELNRRSQRQPRVSSPDSLLTLLPTVQNSESGCCSGPVPEPAAGVSERSSVPSGPTGRDYDRTH